MTATRAAQEHQAVAFGLRWSSVLALRQFTMVSDPEPPDVRIRLRHGPLEPRRAMHRAGPNFVCADGARIAAYDRAVIDIYDKELIEVTPAQDWDGESPIHLYSTAPAVILALRGLVPMHGTAIEVGGKAVLICGESGCGKSTLGAHVIALGGRLIADDLSVLRTDTTGQAAVLTGRPGIKLHPGTVQALGDFIERGRTVPSLRGKLLVHPPAIDVGEALPLGGIILLDGPGAVPATVRFAALSRHIFRPLMMQNLPGQQSRIDQLAKLAKTVPMLGMPGLRIFGHDVARSTAALIVAWMEAAHAICPHPTKNSAASAVT